MAKKFLPWLHLPQKTRTCVYLPVTILMLRCNYLFILHIVTGQSWKSIKIDNIEVLECLLGLEIWPEYFDVWTVMFSLSTVTLCRVVHCDFRHLWIIILLSVIPSWVVHCVANKRWLCSQFWRIEPYSVGLHHYVL